jgi:hypothetical protein
MRTRLWVGLCLAGSLVAAGGCQAFRVPGDFYSSPLRGGDEIDILKRITVPAGMARIYLQHGQTMSYSATDQYAPFCYFLLNGPLPGEQQIQPGVLVVESVWLDETTVRRERPIRVASVATVLDGDRSPVAYQFHFHLKAADASHLVLVCSGAFEMPLTAAPIRLHELRQVLGDYADVRVKATRGAR